MSNHRSPALAALTAAAIAIDICAVYAARAIVGPIGAIVLTVVALTCYLASTKFDDLEALRTANVIALWLPIKLPRSPSTTSSQPARNVLGRVGNYPARIKTFEHAMRKGTSMALGFKRCLSSVSWSQIRVIDAAQDRRGFGGTWSRPQPEAVT